MSLLEIVKWPDPRLREACAPVAEITPRVKALAADMLETMYAAPGRGLAGPQVGFMGRLFVMDTGWKESEPDPLVCINPTLQEVAEDLAINSEGCLSIPGVTAEISRPDRVQMAWTGTDGQRFVRSFDGFGAVCVQHEMDHLDGIVTFDHLTSEARAALETAYEAGFA